MVVNPKSVHNDDNGGSGYDEDNVIFSGVATKGKYPTWKCVCTLSGFHDRPIYDVRW